jgi:hypothetical protein
MTTVGDPVVVIVVVAVLDSCTVRGGHHLSFCCCLPPSCCHCWCACVIPWQPCSLSPPHEQCLQQQLAIVVLSFHLQSTLLMVVSSSCGGCVFLPLPLILVVHPVSTPRAVARGGSLGCCHGVSSILPLVIPLSILLAGACSSGVGVGSAVSCFVSWGSYNVAWSTYLMVIALPWAP